jgi:hypothetical protein
VGERRSAYGVLVVNPERKTPLERHGRRTILKFVFNK